MIDFQNLQDDIGEWADTNVSTSLDGTLKHLLEEVEHLIEDPYNVMNYADVLILVLNAARKAGNNVEDLHKAVETKMTLNKLREWAEADENGIRHHVRV